MTATQVRVLILGSCAEIYARGHGEIERRQTVCLVLRVQQLFRRAAVLGPEVGFAAPVSASLRHEPKGSNPKGLALTRLANDKAVGS
jgi:hypothetical protein